MTPVEAKITQLAARYQTLIGQDHHKDRDCHFTVEQRWSYGDPPTWRVSHPGYLNSYEESFRTREAALEALAEVLAGYVEDAENWEAD